MENGQSNVVFFTRLQDVLNSSFILFETKLEQALYSLAESPLVYSIVERCVKNYDYSQAKQRYLLAPTFERNGAFVSPMARREFIAFSTNLLYEIYEKKVLFTDLLDLYFQGNGYRERFEDFKQRVIAKLYVDLNSVLDDMETLYSSNQQVENLKKQVEISKNDRLKLYVDNLKLKPEDKGYFDYFILKIFNSESVDVCLKALEYILLSYKKGDEYLKEIMEIIDKT